MFIVALFIIAKRWKQRIWPSTDEQINGMCDTHRIEYLGVIKSNQVSIHVATWMNLKDMLGERSQSQKTTYYIISTIRNFE